MSMFGGGNDFAEFLRQLGDFNGNFMSSGAPQMEMVPQYARTFTGNTPLPSKPRPVPGTSSVSPMELLFQALQRDTAEQQGASDRQFERNQGQIDVLSMLIPELSGMVGGAGMDTMQQGQDMAGFLNSLGMQQEQATVQGVDGALAPMRQGVGEARDGLSGIMEQVQGQIGSGPDFSGDVKGLVDGAVGKSDQAAASFKKGMAEYADVSAQNASAMAAGIRRNAQQQMKMVSDGMNPDGSLMTPAQQAAARQQIGFQVEQQVQSVATQQFDRFNETRLAAQQTYSGLLNTAATTRLQGAGTLQQQEALGLQRRAQDFQALGQLAALEGARAELSMQEGAMGLQGEELKARARQARSQLAEAGASLRASTMQARDQAIVQAAQMEMQGRFGLANLVQQNPETVISWFQGLLGFYSAQRGYTSFGGGGMAQGGGGTGNAFANPGGLFGGGGSSDMGINTTRSGSGGRTGASPITGRSMGSPFA